MIWTLCLVKLPLAEPVACGYNKAAESNSKNEKAWLLEAQESHGGASWIRIILVPPVDTDWDHVWEASRIFRLNNISKALVFLDDRHVKLLGIDASGIADGKPSVVLHLVWSIILHFQVKEVMGGLQKHLSSSLSALSMSSYPSSNDLSPQPSDTGTYSCSTLPSKGRKAGREAKYHGKAIKVLLQWVQRCTSKYGVDVKDFGKSWRSGLAFLALVKSINPDMVDLRESFHRDPVENIRQAFMIAHHSLDVPPLLEPEDVTCTSPDEQSIITYVSMFPKCHSGTDEAPTPDIDIPEIPSFGSLESVSFEETDADVPEVQVLLEGLEKSSEQLLWKRWSRRSSGSPRSPSFRTNGTAASDQPAGTASDSHYKKRKGSARSCYSLSSEEGIYGLPSLDSDEEDAYSYILELNKDVFQPSNQLKRQAPKVKEETAEEIKEESKYQGGSFLQKADFELESAQAVVHRKFDFDKNERNLRKMTDGGAALDFKPEGESRSTEEHEEQRANRAQTDDDGDYCEEERGKKMFKNGVNKTEDDAAQATVEVARWQEDTEDRRDAELSKKRGQVGGQDLGNESQDAAVMKEDGKSQKSTNSESFKSEVNGKIITDEAACEVRSDTEEESGRKCKEEKMRDADEAMDSAESGFVKSAAGEETTATEHDGEESP
ncbi:calmin-like, partial [Neolamprologus brichardi]|uniref:calmin-like n=1 Tax=Neolamprologus brichardi TaxID=32507 RepID=UPI001643BB91